MEVLARCFQVAILSVCVRVNWSKIHWKHEKRNRMLKYLDWLIFMADV